MRTRVFDIPPQEVRDLTSASFLRANTNYYYCLCAMPGVDEGQRHSLGGRRSLFPRVQRNKVGDQRGKRPLLDQAVVPDDAAQHPRHQRSAPNPKRPRHNFWIHAGNLRSPIRRPLARTIATNSLLLAIFNFQLLRWRFISTQSDLPHRKKDITTYLE